MDEFKQQFVTTKQVAAFFHLSDQVVRNILPAALRHHGAEPIVGGDNANLVWRLSDVKSVKDELPSELNPNDFLSCEILTPRRRRVRLQAKSRVWYTTDRVIVSILILNEIQVRLMPISVESVRKEGFFL
ncbi:hypothetical protein [Acidocella sp.]|uniref:hypothetical protein n=1 Tax=Acidocella sp. TaxID=50710 RepID=UPI002F42DAF7